MNTKTYNGNDKKIMVAGGQTAPGHDNGATMEMGYLLLQHCSVILPEKDKQRLLHEHPRCWRPVRIVDVTDPNTKDEAPANKHQADHDQACLHCNLVLTSPRRKEKGDNSSEDCEFSLCTASAPRFRGTMADMIHPKQRQEKNNIEPGNDVELGQHDINCRQKRRTDAALWMGAILDAQDHGYVAIQSFQMILHDIEKGGGNCNDNTSSSKHQDDSISGRQKVSLLVTLAFPSLIKQKDENNSTSSSTNNNNNNMADRKGSSTKHSPRPLRSIRPSTSSRGSVNQTRLSSPVTINVKPLPPSVQFLLSVIRSDWGRLDGMMEELERGRGSADTASTSQGRQSLAKTFFPSKLSLEELYGRIRGSASRVKLTLPDQRDEIINTNRRLSSSSLMLTLMSLPPELLKTQIAPFLRSKSLDALRCTCKDMQQQLSMVVPGLKLRLFQHQIKSLQWMRQREMQPVSEAKGAADLLMSNTRSSNTGTFTNPIMQDDNDPIRAMTGGHSVWLCLRGRPSREGGRFDQLTGNEMQEDVQDTGDILARRGARGGFLCDEPGLGKTITILSLILQTMGVSTEREHRETAGAAVIQEDEKSKPDHTPEEEIFLAYWREQVPPEFRRPALCRLITKLKKLDASSGYFLNPIDPGRDGCEDYFDIIQNPICINEIRNKVSKDKYGVGNSDFELFVADVELCFRNAIMYNPDSHEVHRVAKILLDRFQRDLLVQFKQEQLGSLRSSASNTSLKPNSSVALLLQKKSEQEFQKSLIQSSTTLLVIPNVLMEHWEEQIKMHVDFGYCTSKRIPLIYEYTPNRKSALGLEEALRLCQVENTHFPLLFIDKGGTHKLPSPEFLAMFRIVITTTKRFTNEWKNGSFEEELKRRQNEEENRDGKHISYRLMEYGSTDEEACPLLKINWLRMVVDEGHTMGRGKANSAIRFAAWITAERRWAMTGTPTQQTVSHNGLSNMNNLMQFLQHDFFTPRKGGDRVWKRHIARSWKDGNIAAFFRLKSLLSLLMTRHTKLDIEELPLPIYGTSFIPMSPLEVTTYNTLVSAVQQNLKLTSMKGSKTSGEQDSLLYRTQARHALLALTNIRKVCCGGTRVVPRITQSNYVEFVDLCRNQHSLPVDTVRDLELYLGRATTEELSRCYCCGMLLNTLLVVPCGCLLCTECFDGSNVCVMCNKAFDVDDFQLLQPGLSYEWLKLENDVEVAKVVTAEQPNNNETYAVRDDAANDGRGIADRGVADGIMRIGPAQNELLLRPPSERRRTRRPGDGHVCEYSRSFEPGKCTLCFDVHDHCKLVNQNSCCEVCFLCPEDCPKQESKSYYLVNKLLKLYEEDQKKARDFKPLPGFSHITSGRVVANHRSLKVIVFSQFRATLNVVGDRLLRRFGTACVAEYWGSFRTQELHKFIHDPDCFIMLLGKDGSEGLDLSFVTHLFFLEAIWDKSLESQAVARAWRMGATGPVKVESLLAKDSVEEEMHRLETGLAGGTQGDLKTTDGYETMEGILSASEKQNGAEYQRAKVHTLLKSLNLIPELELVPLAAPEEVERRFGPPMLTIEPFSAQEQIEEPTTKKRKTLPRRVCFAAA